MYLTKESMLIIVFIAPFLNTALVGYLMGKRTLKRVAEASDIYHRGTVELHFQLAEQILKLEEMVQTYNDVVCARIDILNKPAQKPAKSARNARRSKKVA